MAVQWTHILEKEVDIDVGDGGESGNPINTSLRGIIARRFITKHS